MSEKKVPFELENVDEWFRKKRICTDAKDWINKNKSTFINIANESGRDTAISNLLQELLNINNLAWAEWYIINRLVEPKDIKEFADYLISRLPKKSNDAVKKAKQCLKTEEGQSLISKLWGFVLEANITNNPDTDLNKLKKEVSLNLLYLC